MRRVWVQGIIFIAATLFAPYFVHGQQADQPTYKHGDWWKLRTDYEAKTSSRNEGCQDSYKDWVVKIGEKGLANLFGINDGKEVRASCESVLGWVFGVNDSKFLKFPLSVGQTWSHRYERGAGRRTVRIEPQYKVVAWEKVQTPKSVLDAFKIEGTSQWVTGRGDHLFNNWTEWYAPAAKAIVLVDSETTNTKRKVMLVDFNVSP